MRSIVIFRFFSHLPLLFVYQCITFLPLIFRFSLYSTAQTQYKYNNFIHFVCFDKIMIKKQIHTLCICRWKALQTTAVSIARKFCFMQWKIKFPTRENKVSPI